VLPPRTACCGSAARSLTSVQFRAQRPQRPAALVLLTAVGVGALAFAGYVLSDREVMPSRTTSSVSTRLEYRPPPVGARENSREGAAIGRPVFVHIPRLDVQARIRPTGVTMDGVARIPRDGDDIGWYRFGPRPGERGSAVLIGHRDTAAEGPGALFAADLLQRGDQVIVKTRSGSVAFAVTSSTYYNKQALPAALFGRHGLPRLTVITCGGAFDAEHGGYQQNYVVVAQPMVRPDSGGDRG